MNLDDWWNTPLIEVSGILLKSLFLQSVKECGVQKLCSFGHLFRRPCFGSDFLDPARIPKTGASSVFMADRPSLDGFFKNRYGGGIAYF